MKRRNPTRVKRLQKQLTELVREFVIKRDNSTCQKCGKTVSGSNCHMSHVKSKKIYPHLRFDPNNLMVLSFKEHLFWWHKEPLEAAAWFKKKFPGRYKYLEKHKNDIKRFREHDYLRMIYNMQKELGYV